MDPSTNTDPYGIGIVLLLMGVAVAAYLFRDRLRDFFDRED